eukprot:TRINITY_DN7655_c1_g2_i2.p1 TRINITY_DN7655_c1_g2~~TRINITY_DN7655_c1_g2_i2.p1  ORF type:complete len:680 (-),score=112.44 TRINITY_DN7655_c1_g2_i2:84-2075(-)
MDGGEEGEEEAEFEVEDILRYRRNEDGGEFFLVKWIGYPESEATWEPLAHMNDNCRELVAKARALFAWRRLPTGSPGSAEQLASGEVAVSSTSTHPVTEAPIAVIEEDGEEQAAAQTGLEEVIATQEEEEEEEEEEDDTEAEEAAVAAPSAPSPQPDARIGLPEPSASGAGTSADVNIIEDDDSPPPAEESQDAIAKRRAELAPPPFAGAPSDPRMKRARLIPPSAPETPGMSTGSWDGAVSSQAKNGPSPATASNGIRHGQVPTSTPTPPAAPQRPASAPAAPAMPPPAPKPPPSKEMKCICGASEAISATSRSSGLIVCKVCNCSLHPACVETALGGLSPPSNFVCPPCRLERVDEFHPTVGSGLLKSSYASSSSTFSLTFSAQAAQWRKQMWAVHLRAVLVSGGDLSGPAWPHKVQGKLNGRQCVAIDPPKHLHVRREQCYNLTPLLKQGANTLELRFTPPPDRPRDASEENYCVGVVLTRPRSVASIISRIRSRSQETVSSGRARVERLLAQVARAEAGQEDECAVTGNFGRTLKPLCPVSHCPIEEAAIGRDCHHVQVFDLQAYVGVNQRMRSLDKRWTCPVCSLPLRPDDVVLHPFAQGILDTLRGDEDLVEAIVFNEDCSWSTISAVKDEKRQGGDGDGDEGDGNGPEMIDLSDSE